MVKQSHIVTRIEIISYHIIYIIIIIIIIIEFRSRDSAK